MATILVPVQHATPEQKANAPFKVSGVKPSPNPHQHWIYSTVVPFDATTLPPKSGNGRPQRILDQGQKGACTGFGGSYHSSHEFLSIDGTWVEYSEDFLYNLARTLDGFPDTEEGSTPLAIMQVKQKFGVPPVQFYPYRADILTVRTDIPPEAYTEALKRKIDAYAKAPSIDEMKHALSVGSTLLSAVLVTDTFMHPEAGGWVGIPQGTLFGGHCVNIFDYDDTLTHTYSNGHQETGFFLFENSWTEQWGDKGIGYLPYSFIKYATQDLGMRFFYEAWTSVPSPSNPPVPKPTPPAPPTPQPQPTPNPAPATGHHVVTMTVDSVNATVDGKPVTMDEAPSINPATNRVRIPLRFVATNLGAEVAYNDSTREIKITL